MTKSDLPSYKQIGLNFTEPLYNAIKAIAEYEDRSFSNLVRIFCIEGIERRQEEARKKKVEESQQKKVQQSQPAEIRKNKA